MGPIVRSHDFSAYGVVVDVGGGSGGLLIELLRAYPALRGVLFELPDRRGADAAGGRPVRRPVLAPEVLMESAPLPLR